MDRASFVLERRLPFFKLLRDNNVLSVEELKELVNDIKRYEHKISCPVPDKDDFYNYIKFTSEFGEYLNSDKFDKIQIDRKEKHKIERYLNSMVVSIYRSAIKKFSNEERFWHEFLNFLQKRKMQKVLDETYSHCLSIFPFNINFWVRAIDREWREKKDFESTRILFQRAIRFLSDSLIIWEKFLEFELAILMSISDQQIDLMTVNDNNTLYGAVLLVHKWGLLSCEKKSKEFQNLIVSKCSIYCEKFPDLKTLILNQYSRLMIDISPSNLPFNS